MGSVMVAVMAGGVAAFVAVGTVASVASGASGASGASRPPGGELRIHVLEVDYHAGGGDAIVVADSTVEPARHVLIDAGDDGAAAGALEALGVGSLDLLVLTHAHYDHYGGMDEVLDAVPVRAFAFNGQVRAAVTYRRLLDRLREEVATVILVDTARTVRLGDAADATVVTLLSPLERHLAADTDTGDRLNDGSLGVRIDRGEFSFLTTGDAEEAANRRFVRRYGERLDVDVLKLGHHGSADATQRFWLDATTPAVAIVSANGTTHPHGRVLRLVRERGIALFCTPRHGRVTIRVDPAAGGYEVETERGTGMACRPGSGR
ncbi:MAG: ComEC/Rec2 family competence protein [Gemmatimonadota bacterium]